MSPNHELIQRPRRRYGLRAVALVALVFGGVGTAAYSQVPRRLRISQRDVGSRRTMMANDIANSSDQYAIPRLRDERIRGFSWMYIDPPQARVVKVHDIISIIVDEKSEVTLRSGFDRQRTANLKAELKEFMRFGKNGNLATAADNQPTIDTNFTSRANSSGRATAQEGIRYRIAATVVDVLPNGTIVLEARKSIRTDHDVWQFSLTGLIRSADVRRDNTALSENIANLDIIKTRDGKVFDSTKRPWGIRLYDLLSPF